MESIRSVLVIPQYPLPTLSLSTPPPKQNRRKKGTKTLLYPRVKGTNDQKEKSPPYLCTDPGGGSSREKLLKIASLRGYIYIYIKECYVKVHSILIVVFLFKERPSEQSMAPTGSRNTKSVPGRQSIQLCLFELRTARVCSPGTAVFGQKKRLAASFTRQSGGMLALPT